MPTNPTRREAIQQLGLGAAAATLGGYTATARGFAKNETINVGIIGCGGRAARALMPKLLAIPGVRVTAVCDVFDHNLAHARNTAAEHSGKPVFATRRHEELLARNDVDAVLCGTPDHWHVPVTIDSANAGKDIYCEKPLTHDPSEGPAVIKAVRDNKRVMQVGTQQRSMPQFAKARELIRAGRLGDVHKVHMTWNRNFTPFRKRVPDIDPKTFDWKRFLGNAPDQPFDPYRALGNWRWFWDFGAGICGDLMVHWQDGVNWLLDLPSPSVATTIGNNYATQGVWETPDTIQTLLQYPDRKMQLHFEGTFVNRHEKAGCTIMGTDATMYIDRGRYEIYPEPGRDPRIERFAPGGGEKGADFDVDGSTLHLANWVQCIRSRKDPVVPVEAGVLAAEAAHLANKAFKKGQVVRA